MLDPRKYICLHCHFYQPPRENPWLEAVELQDSAYPYHDWNERIAAECYAPNTAARILDGDDRIVDIVNNYSRISFNFGPTLLSWLQQRSPHVYTAVLQADAVSRERFSGHGSALAQGYNHIILPLAGRRDKVTQVRWGLRDFEHRFGRPAEGLWLPETAVDLETLEVLAEHDIRFTILAPRQARRVRKIGGRQWREVADGRIDPTRAYEVRLPSERRLAVFFYDGPISRAVAFEGLLTRGDYLASRLLGAFEESRDWAELVHIATDGETYGHHHRHGDMALAYALNQIESNGSVRLTNYGEYLERFPPTHQVEIFENSSWSCEHGIERWRSDCGCNSGGYPGWNQRWRAPLREALDWLSDRLGTSYEGEAGGLLKDPWAARDDYIELILDRSAESLDRFLDRNAAGGRGRTDVSRVLKLLEVQRHLQLMYTSCGWFFDELSGTETVQVLRYAGRAIQLAAELGGASLEEDFLERLKAVPSNLPEHVDGTGVYESFVRNTMVDLPRLAAHYAVSSLFEDYPKEDRVYCYEIQRHDYRTFREGKAQLALGRARFISSITRDSRELDFSVLYFGDHNLHGAVRDSRGAAAFQELLAAEGEIFEQADLPELIRLQDEQFGPSSFSLKSLFRDEQRRVVNRILESALDEAASMQRQLYRQQAPLMKFLGSLGIPLPHSLRVTGEMVLNNDLLQTLRASDPDLAALQRILDTAARDGVPLDSSGIPFAMQQTVGQVMHRVLKEPASLAPLRQLEEITRVVRRLPFEVDLWKVQNAYFELLRGVYPHQNEMENAEAREWVELFRKTGTNLRIRVP